MTRQEDIWNCQDCGQLQGRHDMWFDGICENCNTENKHMKKWIVLDWAGRRCFSSKAFDTYEQGWDFLLQAFPSEDGDDNELGEYRVVEDSTPHHDLNALGNAVLNQVETDLQDGTDYNPWSELIAVLCEREENIEILRCYLSDTARQNLDEGKTHLRYDEEILFANAKLKLGNSKK